MKYTSLLLWLPILLSCCNNTNNQEQSNKIKDLEERLKKLESSSNVRTSQNPEITYNDNSYISFCLNFNKSICTKFDLEKVANDIPEIIGHNVDKDRITISKKNISSKDGKLYLHGEIRETDGKDVKMELKKENGVWMFEDESYGWTKLSEYLTTSN